MQCMLLLYSDRSGWDALPPAQRDEWMGAYVAYTQALRPAFSPRWPPGPIF